MQPTRDDVYQLAQALVSVSGGLERARRRIRAASLLSVLQVVAATPGIRPSHIATRLLSDQSLVTRQIQALETAGQVVVTTDPTDRRSYCVSLSEAGQAELARLTEFGLDRFSLFVANWPANEVRTLTRLLLKFQQSTEAIGEPEATRRVVHRRRRS